MQLDYSVIFASGLALLLGLGAVVGRLLARDYGSGRHARVRTVALVWALTGLHFALVALAAAKSTWHFGRAQPLALVGGIATAAVGAAISLGAAHAFRSLKRLNFLDDTHLVTQGIYRWSRNPQLLGWTLVLLGTGLARQSAMVLLLATVGFVGYRLHLPTEEEHLRRVHGQAYEDYRLRTHRYLGRPRGAPHATEATR